MKPVVVFDLNATLQVSPGAAAPQYRARDVRELADQLVARYGGTGS